ncbi:MULTISPECIES: formimidoylglutamate deiminase [unclassified Rhizobacter]|uniref:formimidoylglutamate deiminase n=1 Tax=unclassified Rhizobacter TaxID=2640088 RepID=UPI0006FEBC2D|nr:MULTISPECIES: formimidoylglutamate deiminase [unclassified Rhizobacter]KQU78216.1 N-formimino-L-glutamate deiminase [Rhizobacter sp. Root29]KQW15962.1 N-formimino-L-glutamate deiminase [Rhizobacter sp. Root1238]KRB25080.1 N-formimino-L-glutamate deiminase [Rhizobacter sp. Root16D2]
MSPAGSLFASHALLPQGWADDVLLQWDDAGTLTCVEAGLPLPAGTERVAGVLLPGLPNLHSHAFQRAFAGLTEHRSAEQDSFWSWRTLMYGFAQALTPDALQAIATQLYIEMLQAGYTAVCEFHYVHHQPDGRVHADAAEMSLRLVAAARDAGIGLTMLPVLYQASGFGRQPALAGQRRFLNSVDGLLSLIGRLRHDGVRVGAAPHSLRAVPPEALRDLLGGLHGADASAPVHIHVAEQQREVDDCLAWSGQRPVQWLLDHAAVDARWCLVHATHLDAAERRALARSGAVAGLCPSTEANLGDGVFDAEAFIADGGYWGIGSDSHACVDAAEELRLLEYGQRLTKLRRNVLASAAHPQVADAMWLSAVAGGARASGRSIAGLRVGQQADFVHLAAFDDAGLAASQRLARHVFSTHGARGVRDVWVAGQRRVHDGQHAGAGRAAEAFVAARTHLLEHR